ncbi:TonB-linked outer membrane protein, SusC/RagA family [Tenacibaculum sp. MAR_2009_124]|uniref:SusC/RagA family TonB-linked outer membrane protein n=1 Tax=Tenacibaculum sp. MAR_2009_124 TaxID=1250059 RepID=UPI0008944B9D|nr:SusC/RagA family TonB-linked outer membrane protein [Tenacibaculum sp. MAR_2009_124]SEB78317.1 TonB-linked outer membrane protein, SusC/RagA family [Tenacibaculum sp. MAR_2009_124]
MKTKFNGILTLFFALFVQISFAQEKTISGTVSDESGPLPGVTVLKKGTTQGTETDFDGKYSLNSKSGDVLVFSFVGMTTVEKTVGASNTMNVTMEGDNILDEVVVTALGIKKDTRAVGYAVQQVGAETINNSNANDAISALTGQASGVQVINASGSAGAGSRIVIRGQTSLNGDNQALLIVDGVRINNSQFNTESRVAGVAGSNRGMDINPADVESINVLKGAAAAALYGVEGGNGVIVITTKKGKSGKIKVNLRSNVTFSEANRFPKLQNTFVQGSNGVWSGPETGTSGSWGPNKDNLYWDGSSYDYDKNGRIVVGNTTGSLKKFQPYDVLEVFQTGATFENSVSLSGGGEKTTFRMSYSDFKEEGIIPKNEFNRRTLNFSGSAKVNDRLNVTLSGTYTNSDSYRIQQGSNTSGIMLGLLRTPNSFDNSNGFSNADNQVSAYEFEDGSQRNYRGGGGYDNPYWVINNTPYTDEVNRFTASLGIDYKVTDWMSFNANIGLDTYADTRKQFFDIGSRTSPAGTIFLDDYNYRHMDSYFNLNGNFDVTEDFNMGYILGANIYSEQYTRNYTQGDDLGIKGFDNITNASTVIADHDLFREKNIGFYGQLDFNYKRMLYLTVTGRQDYLSTLEDPVNFNLDDLALFYPSANLGFVFSELTGEDNFLNFGKLRLSWAQVGAGAPSPYATSTAYETASFSDGWANGYNFPYSGNAGFQIDNTLGNNNLVPSTVTSYEIGTDLRMFNNRITLDFAYYNRLAEDQILAVPIANSTGYTSSFLNSGELETTGYEATINAKIIDKEDFKWNLGINFDKSETIVNKLADGVENQFIGGFVIYNIPGERYGQIFGGSFLRDDNGNILIDDDPNSANYGLQIADPDLKVIGDPTPDFTLGFNNTFTYKNWSLNFLLEWKEGGEMWNGTEWALSFFGRSEITENRGEQLVIEGVKQSDGSPNDIVATIDQYYYQSSGLSGFGSVDEAFIQDTSWIRLRTLNLSYDLTQDLNSSYFDSIILTFSGNNLWLDTPYRGVDPETSLTGAGSNAQGVDYFNNPGTKSFGFGVNVTF